MRYIKIIALSLLTLALLSACKGKSQNRINYLPSITGKAGEVLVVVEKPYWEGEIGSELRNTLTADYPFLPQKETLFTVYNAPHSSMKGAFLLHRNIIVINTGTKVDTAGIKFQSDVWAYPQIVITVSAPTKEETVELLVNNREKIINAIEQKERDRIINNSKKFENRDIRVAVTKTFGGSPYFTKDYSIKKKSSDFIWVSHETTFVNQGIFIYRLPYVELNEIKVEEIVPQINEMLRSNVPGMRDNSYMVVSKMIQPGLYPITYNKQDIMEIRGLWELENDYMGGPFICHIMPEKSHNHLLVIQGFVYAPKYDKRNYLRYVESIIYSFEWAK